MAMVTESIGGLGYIAVMARKAKTPADIPQIRKGSKPHLYVQEHIKAKELSDTVLAGRLEIARETVWKWRTNPERLDTTQLARLAFAVGLDSLLDFYRPPGQPSIDAKLAIVPDNEREKIISAVDGFLGKKTG